MSARLRVVIADDHPLYRDGLRIVLSSSEVAEVVGEASNGTQAVALAAERPLRWPENKGEPS